MERKTSSFVTILQIYKIRMQTFIDICFPIDWRRTFFASNIQNCHASTRSSTRAHNFGIESMTFICAEIDRQWMGLGKGGCRRLVCGREKDKKTNKILFVDFLYHFFMQFLHFHHFHQHRILFCVGTQHQQTVRLCWMLKSKKCIREKERKEKCFHYSFRDTAFPFYATLSLSRSLQLHSLASATFEHWIIIIIHNPYRIFHIWLLCIVVLVDTFSISNWRQIEV